MLPIRIKITFWYAAIFSVTLLLFSLFLFIFVSHEIIGNTDAGLISEARESKSIFLEEVTKPSFEELDEELKGISYYLQIYSMTGRLLYSSANLYKTMLPVDVVSLRSIKQGRYTFRTLRLFKNRNIRMLTYPFIVNERPLYYINIAVPLTQQNTFLYILSIILAVVTPIVIIVASWGGLLIAHRAMKPVEDITIAARRIEAGRLDERINVKTHNDEIGRLANTFDDMLSRLKVSFDKLASFSHNASHELKTPLTVIKSGIEVSLREDRTVEEYKGLLESLLEEVNQMTRVIDDLLLTALSETASIKNTFATVNLSELLTQTIDFLNILAVDKHILFERRLQNNIMMRGNEHLLKRLFSNIIDNAIKFTPSGKRVFISIAKKEGGIEIVISDQGIGIPKDEIPRIFDRFYRGKNVNVRGHGLGLSITKWIVELHNGAISVDSTSEGTDFRIRFS